MTSNINKDKFLRRQGIQVQGSQFLQKTIQKKQKGIKDEYNVRDLHGFRLSKHWQAGDTVFSVAAKISKQRMISILNPDTYSKQSLSQLRQDIIKQKIKIMGIIITLALPITLYMNFLRPRLDRVKRMYYMQFYNKMGFFSKELGIKTKEVSQKDLEKEL